MIDTQIKSFNKLLFSLAIPIMFQNLLTSLLNLLDSVMIGKLSEDIISAITLANQPFFIISLVFFGVSSGISVLTSQYWGKGDNKTISKILGMVLSLIIAITFIYSIAVFVFSKQIMRLYSKEDIVVSLGANYLRIVVFSYLPTAISTVSMMCMRSIEQIKTPLKINVLAIGINTFFNYCLIFGKFGFPRLEERGAAIATVFARLVEVVLFLYYLFKKNPTLRVKFSYLFKFDKLLILDFTKYSLPVLLNETLWGLGISVQTMIVGNLGKNITSAWAINVSLQNLAFVSCIGICNAIGILIGKAVGQNENDTALSYIKNGLKTVALSGLVGSALILLIRIPFISLYNITPQTKAIALTLTACLSVAFYLKCFSCTYIVGILRGAGDSRFAFITDVAFLWAISIPLGYIAAFYLQLPIWAIYFIFVSDELIKSFVCYFRVKSGKFIKNVTRDIISD